MKHLNLLFERYPRLAICKSEILDSYAMLERSFVAGGKLILAGNGGSAADCDHIVGELMKSFVRKRRPSDSFLDVLQAVDPDSAAFLSDKLQNGLPAIALPNQTALITASLNDVDGNVLFAQQVLGYGRIDDIFLGISTSGNAKNIIYATSVAKAIGMKTIALTGNTGGRLAKLADSAIIVPETETFKIQELHLPIYHALCLELEERFFP